jgi:hypothetical protein
MSVAVVELAPEHEFEYCRWLARMRDRSLGVKLALDENGAYAGMIQYYPTSYSQVSTDENGIWFIH